VAIREALAAGAEIETRRRLSVLARGAIGEETLGNSLEDPIDFEEILVLGDHGVFQSQGEVVKLGPPDRAQASPGSTSEALTPLMQAAKEGQAKAVALLLDLGATPHAQAEDGMTPLHFAASAGCRESCQALLRAGANRWVLDDHERDPLACLPPHLVSTRESQATWVALLRATPGGRSPGPPSVIGQARDVAVTPRQLVASPGLA